MPAASGAKVHLITFGCEMNINDSEAAAGILRQNDFVLVDKPEDADVILINTCCVREHAVNRAYGNIRSLEFHRKKNAALIIGMGGCLARRDSEDIFNLVPNVDFVYSPEDIPKLPEILTGLSQPDLGFRNVLLHSAGAVRRHSHKGMITIVKGCNNFCTYCIVPHVRGREMSRSLDDIVQDVKALVRDGVVEITLLGQNVNSWGRGLPGNPDFCDLLRAVSETDVTWIRFVTSHPRDFSMEMVELLSSSEKFARHINLPAQSGSDRILKMMNRGYNREHYLKLADAIRELMPDAAISTDLMAGFPGETREDFEMTLSLIETVKFDDAHLYFFSPQPGTKAAEMQGILPENERKARLSEMIDLQRQITLKKNKALIGTTSKAMVEGVSSRSNEEVRATRSDGRAVIFRPPEGTVASDMVSGTMIEVQVTEAYSNSLKGKLKK